MKYTAAVICRFYFISNNYDREDSKMKRMTPYSIAITLLALGSFTSAWADCSRDKLDDTMGKYFESLTAHSTSKLPLAPDAKFTENGVKKDVREGFWKTAGKPLLKRILIDTKKCSAAAIAVIEEKFDPKTVGQGGMRGFGGGGSGGPGGMMGRPKEMPAEGTVRPILFAETVEHSSAASDNRQQGVLMRIGRPTCLLLATGLGFGSGQDGAVRPSLSISDNSLVPVILNCSS